MSECLCCIDGCTRPGTVSANHDGASLYCVEHGICARCHESVEFFTFSAELNIWLCPCRHLDLRPMPDVVPVKPVKSNVVEFGKYVTKRKKTS